MVRNPCRFMCLLRAKDLWIRLRLSHSRTTALVCASQQNWPLMSQLGHEQTNRPRQCRVCLCLVNRLQSATKLLPEENWALASESGHFGDLWSNFARWGFHPWALSVL